jgi:GTP-binding protein HflX
MGKLIETGAKQETCVLVGISTQEQSQEELEEYLDELEFLAKTAKAVCKYRFTQNMEKANPKTFLGSGKIEEVLAYVVEHEIDSVIFDDELSPSQIRNIERLFNPDEFAEHQVKILDRSNLILDIFAQRARTAHSKTQVELAQYQYLLPRLTNLWTHLSKQKGGIGMKGPGETEIETDRRVIRDKIFALKKRLETIDKQMSTQRSNRGALVRVALVGYTNAGKSTLMNVLSKSEVFAENKLFATLDTTVRKVVLGNLPFLLADTVGFIRKLPHQLVESFKSTLDETREADILMHIVDVSHPNFEDHFRVVNETLEDIGCLNKPTITVLNKIDAYSNNVKPTAPDEISEEVLTLRDLKHTWMQKLGDQDVTFISATKKENLQELRDVTYERVKEIHSKRFPYNNYYY